MPLAELPKERTRLRAVDPYRCKHPKLIPIWKYRRFPGKTYCTCLICGREMVVAISSNSVPPVTHVKEVIRDDREVSV